MSGEDQQLCADPLLCGSELARDALAFPFDLGRVAPRLEIRQSIFFRTSNVT
jgi:hypothetical protein